MSKLFRAMMLFALLLTFTLAAPAQMVATGTPPFSTIGGGSLDKIDLANLNIHFCIPFINKTGRGTPFTYSMCYDSSIWGPSWSWLPNPTWGWTVDTPAQSAIPLTGYVTYSESDQPCYGYDYYANWGQQGDTTYYQNYTYTDKFGVSHAINYSIQIDQYWGTGGGSGYDDCNQDNNTYYNGDGSTSDSSGYWMGTGNYHMYSASGADLNAPVNSETGSGTYTDRNGNQITTDGAGDFTDTLGMRALTISGGGSTYNFSYTPPGGGSASYQMHYNGFNIRTNFACSNIGEYTGSAQLITEIDLPDIASNPNDKYTFQYEPTPGYGGYYTGRIASITLPTGGQISYIYPGDSGYSGSVSTANNGIACNDGSTTGFNRVTPDTTNGAHWDYARVPGGSPVGISSTLTVTDPNANQSKMQFVGVYMTQEDDYTGTATGTPLRTISNCYNSPTQTPPCNGWSQAFTSPIGEVRSFLQWGGSGGIESLTDTQYDYAGNQTEKDEYAYGSGSPGSLLRKTLTPYNGGSPDELQSTTVQDGSGHTASETTYTYDGAGVQTTSGTPQHVSGVNSGNLTSESTLVSGSTYLTKSFIYYDTGNVHYATDVNGAVTTTQYGACGNSFPTEVDEAISPLKQYMTWDCNGAMPVTATDENGKAVSSTYNSAYFWRPASVTDQLSNVMNFSYTPNSVEASMNFGSSTTDVLATVDSMGRQYVSQQKQSPSSGSYDSVETTYNNLGQPFETTVPYSGSAGATCSAPCPGASATYDALGRVTEADDAGGGWTKYTYTQNDVLVSAGPHPSGENTKDKQLEYDALGRLTSVCEISSSLPGVGTCGQTNPRTGYWTKYTYDANDNLTSVVQNAQSSTQQTRTYAYDDLGRMTSETNPESGTTTYTYDSACGNTFKGDLGEKIDAAGKWTCYWYDSLHRLTDVGTNNGADGCKRFRYDNTSGVLGTIPSGVTVSNIYGRLAEAETDTCAWPITQSSIITDEWFGYDARGEQTDLYESTPHSGGYYHTQANYWANGQPQTIWIQNGYWSSYALDGEGRIASNGNSAVTSTTYNAASQPTQIDFGSGDSDNFAYDSNTGRMTQYKYNVNGQSVTGNLSWNPLGTLNSLSITDPFNGSNTQTCSYSHDDLSRVASDNCGSVWSQNFNYDAFGNLQKSGSSNFSANYDPNTNHMTSIGGSAPSYDGDGNVTNDFLHTYAWNAYGRPTTVDGVTITYDATDRPVEQNRGGSYSELWYSPTGFMMQISVPGGVDAFVPGPAGTMAIWTPSTVLYRHPDWLGSSRFSSDQNRTMYSDSAYGPFGDVYAQAGASDESFTGMNQDTSSNLYDFPARELGIQGRWSSPDPLGIGAADPTDPQSWNRYAYVRNSPLNLTDPNGMVYQVCMDGYDINWAYIGCGDIPGDSPSAVTSYLSQFPGRLEAEEGDSADSGPIMSLSDQAWAGTWTYLGPDVLGTTVTVCGDCAQPPATDCHDTLAGCGAPIDPGQPGTASGSGDPGGGGFGITFGVRAPGQTYGQCLAANSETYSIAGVARLSGLPINSGVGKFLLGNDIAQLLFGDRSDGASGLVVSEGGSRAFEAGVGTVTTFGRRTATVMSLNLKGVTGPAPRILAKTGAEEIAEWVAGIAELKLVADAGLAGAEAVGCILHQ